MMLSRFILSKLNIILVSFAGLFLVSYVLFSGLSTSLDFKMDKLSKKQNEAREAYEQALSTLAQAESKDALLAASAGLNMTEVTLANGYIDIRPETLSSAATLAKRP